MTEEVAVTWLQHEPGANYSVEDLADITNLLHRAYAPLGGRKAFALLRPGELERLKNSDVMRKWIDALIRFESEPDAEIPCPQCARGNLTMNDVRLSDTHVERFLRCPKCGAHNSARQTRPL
jgi:hypothetical protein